MKMDKILNSRIGIVLAVPAVLFVCRTLRLVSYTVLQMGGAVVVLGLIVLAYSSIRKNN